MSRINIATAVSLTDDELTRDCKAYVPELPKCQATGCTNDGEYDLRTRSGQWGNFCRDHALDHGTYLGTGWGQRLIVGPEPERDRHAEIQDAIMRGDMSALEDAIGDGDIADYL